MLVCHYKPFKWDRIWFSWYHSLVGIPRSTFYSDATAMLDNITDVAINFILFTLFQSRFHMLFLPKMTKPSKTLQWIRHIYLSKKISLELYIVLFSFRGVLICIHVCFRLLPILPSEENQLCYVFKLRKTKTVKMSYGSDTGLVLKVVIYMS